MSLVNVATPDQTAARMTPEKPVAEEAINSLAAYIRNCFSTAYRAKLPITERLLQCERQRRGKYDPDKLAEIRKSGGSEIYMMLTDVKCRGAEAWINDVLIASGDRPWGLDPEAVPDLPNDMKLEIVRQVVMEAQEVAALGEPVTPAALQLRAVEIRDEIKAKLKAKARDSADAMEDEIDTQLREGGFYKALMEFIDDFVTFPAAWIKGPVIRRKKTLSWSPKGKAIVKDALVKEFYRVSPYDIFPSPSCTNPHNGYIVERHRLHPSALESMIGVKGYKDDEIKAVLTQHQYNGLHTWLMEDMERQELEGHNPSVQPTDTIDALEFSGTVAGQLLIEWGMPGIEAHSQYEINAWVIGNHVIKAVLNNDPLNRRPYECASWKHIAGSVWGTCPPELMRDTQAMCNNAARALANNMAIASGPQVEVQVDRLPDGESITQMHPWKIWQTTSDLTGGGQPAIRFFQPDLNADALIGVYNNFARQSDEVTGIPNYVYGSAQVSGAGRTSSGLAMLMDNASKGLKNAISNIDYAVTGLIERMFALNMQFNPNPDIKGDCKVIARGALGLMVRQSLQARRTEFLQATANPIDAQIMGPDGRAYLLREAAKTLELDTDQIVPDPERLKAMQRGQALTQMAQQAQGQQAPQPQELNPAGAPAGGADMQPPQ